MANKIAVEVRAEGANGYTVVFREPNGTPHDLIRFTRDQPAVARAFRDGFAAGLQQSASVLHNIVMGQ